MLENTERIMLESIDALCCSYNPYDLTQYMTPMAKAMVSPAPIMTLLDGNTSLLFFSSSTREP